MSKKWGVFIIALLVIVLIRQSIVLNELRNFQSNIGNVSNWLNTVDNQINRLSIDLKEMDKEDDLIQSMDFRYDPIESQGDTTDVDLTFTLNKTKLGDSVMMYYRPIDTEKWESIVLERVDGTEYMGSFISDYSSDYETKLVVQSDDTLYTESGYNLYLYTNSLPQYGYQLEPRSITSDGILEYEASIDIYRKGENTATAVRATVEVYRHGELLDAFELMQDEFKQFEEEDFIVWDADRSLNFEPSGDEKGFGGFEWVLTVEDSIGRMIEHRESR